MLAAQCAPCYFDRSNFSDFDKNRLTIRSKQTLPCRNGTTKMFELQYHFPQGNVNYIYIQLPDATIVHDGLSKGFFTCTIDDKGFAGFYQSVGRACSELICKLQWNRPYFKTADGVFDAFDTTVSNILVNVREPGPVEGYQHGGIVSPMVALRGMYRTHVNKWEYGFVLEMF